MMGLNIYSQQTECGTYYKHVSRSLPIASSNSVMWFWFSTWWKHSFHVVRLVMIIFMIYIETSPSQLCLQGLCQVASFTPFQQWIVTALPGTWQWKSSLNSRASAIASRTLKYVQVAKIPGLRPGIFAQRVLYTINLLIPLLFTSIRESSCKLFWNNVIYYAGFR
jgi:hypothetical protein